MENEYKIENLIETFKEHAKKYEEQRQIARQRYKENNDGAELPYDDSFSISKALMVICEEIVELKKSMAYGRTYQRFR